MHTKSTGRPFRPFSAPKANSSSRIALLHGARRSGAHGVVGGILVYVVGQYGASEHHRPASHAPTLVSGSSPFCASRMAMHARMRKLLRPNRVPVTEAGSPPGRPACFPHPVRGKARGRSVAAQEAPLEIYNDKTRDMPVVNPRAVASACRLPSTATAPGLHNPLARSARTPLCSHYYNPRRSRRDPPPGSGRRFPRMARVPHQSDCSCRAHVATCHLQD